VERREFYITGYKPAYGKKVNDMAKAFDLGTDGAFIRFTERMVATLSDNITEEKLAQQPKAIKSAYESSGCVDVIVVAIT